MVLPLVDLLKYADVLEMYLLSPVKLSKVVNESFETSPNAIALKGASPTVSTHLTIRILGTNVKVTDTGLEAE